MPGIIDIYCFRTVILGPRISVCAHGCLWTTYIFRNALNPFSLLDSGCLNADDKSFQFGMAPA